MGCVGSKASSAIPGLSSSPCIEYAESRRKAVKDLVTAQEGLLSASTDSAEAMKGVGQSLKVFCASTNVFENPSFNPLPPLVPIAAAAAPAEAAPVAASIPPPAHVVGDGAAADVAPASAEGNPISYPPIPAPTAPPPPSPPPEPGMQLVAVNKHAEKKKRLEDLSKKIDDLFTEIGVLTSKPVHDTGKLGISLGSKAYPALTLANSKLANGKLEPIGDSLHKLHLWETHLKEDVKTMEGARSQLKKSDKKLDKQSNKAAKDPNADLRKVRASQGKVNDAQAKLDTSTKAIHDTYLSIEQYKAEVIFPQFCRLFPLLSEGYGKMASLLAQQQSLAAEIAALDIVAPSPPVLNEDASLLTSSVTDIHGEATKGNHEATKALDAAYVKWSKAHEANIAAQKKCCQALQAWVKAITAAPGDFPKPDAAALAAVPTGPLGHANVEHTISTMAGDWERALNGLPTAGKESMATMSSLLKTAYELQVKGHKEHKKLDAAKRELIKAEGKLTDAKKAEEDARKKAEDLKMDPTKAKEQEKAASAALKATDGVSAATGTLQGSQMKYKTERETYAKALYEECNAAGAVLKELPDSFSKLQEFASAASTSFKALQTQHANWMGAYPGA